MNQINWANQPDTLACAKSQAIWDLVMLNDLTTTATIPKEEFLSSHLNYTDI